MAVRRPPRASTGARGLQAGLRALADQLALEFADRAEDLEHSRVTPVRSASSSGSP